MRRAGKMRTSLLSVISQNRKKEATKASVDWITPALSTRASRTESDRFSRLLFCPRMPTRTRPSLGTRSKRLQTFFPTSKRRKTSSTKSCYNWGRNCKQSLQSKMPSPQPWSARSSRRRRWWAPFLTTEEQKRCKNSSKLWKFKPLYSKNILSQHHHH